MLGPYAGMWETNKKKEKMKKMSDMVSMCMCVSVCKKVDNLSLKHIYFAQYLLFL